MSDCGDDRRGRLVVLVGPSAVGKSTVVRCARQLLPELVFSVSATTREARPGEVNGVDYHFVSGDMFDRMIASGDLLEWAEIHRGLHRSGTPAGPVRSALNAGRPVLVEVDLNGARAIKRTMPDALQVFMAPPSFEELVARLVSRGTETSEVVGRRLETARIELAARDEFDRVIVNDDVQRACGELVSLLVGRSVTSSATGCP